MTDYSAVISQIQSANSTAAIDQARFELLRLDLGVSSTAATSAEPQRMTSR
jgi:hypothetical protein